MSVQMLKRNVKVLLEDDSLMDLGRLVVACALLTFVVLVVSLFLFQPFVTVVLTGIGLVLTLIAGVMELKGWDKKRS